jgi:hypothetical protein
MKQTPEQMALQQSLVLCQGHADALTRMVQHGISKEEVETTEPATLRCQCNVGTYLCVSSNSIRQKVNQRSSSTFSI